MIEPELPGLDSLVPRLANGLAPERVRGCELNARNGRAPVDGEEGPVALRVAAAPANGRAPGAGRAAVFGDLLVAGGVMTPLSAVEEPAVAREGV